MIKNRKKMKRVLLFFLLLIVIIYLSKIYLGSNEEKNLEVNFLDAGQADAILITTPQQHKIIIDFGSEKALPELDKKIPWWNKKIDLIIITHPHDDHILGMIALLNKYEIKQIMYTGVLHYSPAYLDLLKLIEDKNIDLIIPQENQVIGLGNNCSISILFPIKSFYNKEVSNINNSSIVSKLTCQNSTWLFMGDAEVEVEDELLHKKINIKSDVLKAGHHGSITSSQQKFLEEVDPQIAVIMVGQDNKFNHPSLRTIKKMEKLNIQVFRTDLDQTVTIISDGQKIYQQK